jgi:hypothetical protein
LECFLVLDTALDRNIALRLYEKHYVENDFERIDLFRLLVERFGIQSALYPGSFAHLSPSIVIPAVTYVDTDGRCPNFFSDQAVHRWLQKRRAYAAQPVVEFIARDYLEPSDKLDNGSFDLLISQWAGPVSQACKLYLKVGGLLLVNDSHGDASLASLDDDYELVATVVARPGKYSLNDEHLDSFFVPKGNTQPSKEAVLAVNRGLAYQRKPPGYIFERIDTMIRRL